MGALLLNPSSVNELALSCFNYAAFILCLYMKSPLMAISIVLIK